MKQNSHAKPAFSQRINLRDDYSICRLEKGNWQLTPDHLSSGRMQPEEDIMQDFKLFLQSGYTTFDVADIYTGAEELIGKFIKSHKNQMESGELPQIQVHTKYVPDINTLPTLKFADTEAIIDRSLKRLNVNQLDLVQFHWWDFTIGDYVEAASHLQRLKDKGKIRYLGVTNFDAEHLQKIMKADVDIVSAQVQYSVLDRRPAGQFTAFCRQHDIKMLCYGSLAGGLLSDRYLSRTDIQERSAALDNRSLTKYRLVIEEFGGWDLYQEVLRTMYDMGEKYRLSISEMAMLYTLSRPGVAAAIIGARNSNYISSLDRVAANIGSQIDWSSLDELLGRTKGPQGDIYHLERNESHHKGVMKYKLNSGSENFGTA